jgi:Protein of unknown function (DUF3303)
MKYLISWTARAGGSAADNDATVKRSLAVFSKWSPPADATFHQFLARLDGTGGFAVVETDNPASVAEGPTKFGPYFEFDVTPVMDITEGAQLASEGAEFRDSVS